LEEEFITNALQELSGLPVACCDVPSACIEEIEVPHEDEGL